MKLELKECEECGEPFMATEDDKICIVCYLTVDDIDGEGEEQQIEG